MSNFNEIKTRTITLEIDNPLIKKTVVFWKSEIDANGSSITNHKGEWLEKPLQFKYFHPKHEELALDVIYAGQTKMQVRAQVSKSHGIYFSCDLTEDEHLTIRIS